MGHNSFDINCDSIASVAIYKEIDKNTSCAISYMRIIAMCSIVTCHLFQAYNIYQMSSIFNLGVQVFLFISGYIYGLKLIDNWKKWVIKRLLKLFVPYWLLIVFFFLIMFFVGDVNGGISPFVFLAHLCNLQGLNVLLDITCLRVPGLQHLWFMTAIMMSYFFLPLLQNLRKISHAIILLVGILWIVYMFMMPRIMWSLEWILLFSSGYMYSSIKKTKHHSRAPLIFTTILMIISAITIFFFMSDMALQSNLNKTNRIFHSTFGAFVTILGINSLTNLKIQKLSQFLLIFDKYSFHIYLVHFIFMIGPFSFAYISSFKIVNICIMLFLTMIFTTLFVRLLNNVEHYVVNVNS